VNYHLYDAVLDPIIIVNEDGDIRYLNPITTKWLTLPADFGFIGKNISQFVTFKQAEVFSAMTQLNQGEYSAYTQTYFTFALRKYEAYALVGVHRMPDEGQAKIFAILIRDRALVKVLFDDHFDLWNLPLRLKTKWLQTI
jgi:PAS domain-containing protein